MGTPLEKARRSPESMKARILAVARRVFGKYGYHGSTTRLIAKEVGIDISTLYYHWGEKNDLYQAVMTDINEDLGAKLQEVERIIHGKPLAKRMRIAFDILTDHFFDSPEIAKLTLFRYVAKTREEAEVEINVPEFISQIARSMEICDKKKPVPPEAHMKILAMMNAIYNFISGESTFRQQLGLDRPTYIQMVKDTLNFIMIPAFAGENIGKSQ